MRLKPLTHLLHFKEDGRKPIRVTDAQISAWEEAKKRNATLKLMDEGFGQAIYHGDPWAIKEATPIVRPKSYLWICDYGLKHEMSAECDCYKKYAMPPWKFKEIRKSDI